MGRKKLQKLLSLGLMMSMMVTTAVGGSTTALASDASSVASSEASDSDDAVQESSEVATESAEETGETENEAESTEETGETEDEAETSETSEEYVSERISTNYSVISSGYTMSKYAGEDMFFPVSENVTSGEEHLSTDVKDYTESSQVLDLTIDDTVTLSIDVPSDGLYFLEYDYLSYDESILPIELSMMIDGEYPFYE